LLIHALTVRQDIDKLVDEWTPELLGPPLTPEDQADLASFPRGFWCKWSQTQTRQHGKAVLNLASYDLTGLAGNETIKVRAIETLRKYGVGSCGTPGFYGSLVRLCSQCILGSMNSFAL
jgi:serine palmitoyltransferase